MGSDTKNKASQPAGPVKPRRHRRLMVVISFENGFSRFGTPVLLQVQLLLLVRRLLFHPSRLFECANISQRRINPRTIQQLADCQQLQSWML